MRTTKDQFTPDVLAKNLVKCFVGDRKDCIYISDLILQLQQIQNIYSNQSALTVLYQRLTGDQHALPEFASLIRELQIIINPVAYDMTLQISILKIIAKYFLSNDVSPTGNQIHGSVIKLIIDNNSVSEEISLDHIQSILAIDGGKRFKAELDNEVKSSIAKLEYIERVRSEKHETASSDGSDISFNGEIIEEILRDESPVSQQPNLTPVHNLNLAQNFFNMLGLNFSLYNVKESDDEEEAVYSRHRLSE